MADRIISGILFRVTKTNSLDWLSVRTVDQMSCLRLLKKMDQSKTQYSTFPQQQHRSFIFC